ncbi:MAG: 3-dehydroquinate synthase [Syntrophomonadaceae bacterium]|mgnify:CR=1 FL=1|jgi:3-dehydroquinate synthase
MRKMIVDLAGRSYPIIIAPNQLQQCGELTAEVIANRKALLVSNPRVFGLYGEKTVSSLQQAGFQVQAGIVPEGETYKNMAQANRLLDMAMEQQLERDSIIIALGGGVIGDLAGFVAAIYQRGINFIQLPTTLLAQVDSSVGGKVAVNHPAGKNMIGAFHQPRLVIIDPDTLTTLEDREYRSGLGEVIKYGIVCDEQLFDYLETNLELLNQKDLSCITEVIYRCCKIKAAIVEQDETETGLRAVLNLGHTFGHAVEKLGNYETWRHGEAVAMGTMAAAYLALDYGYITEQQLERIEKLYKHLNIDCLMPDFPPEHIYNHMLNDKKMQQNRLRLILPAKWGEYIMLEAPEKPRVLQAILHAQGS